MPRRVSPLTSGEIKSKCVISGAYLGNDTFTQAAPTISCEIEAKLSCSFSNKRLRRLLRVSGPGGSPGPSAAPPFTPHKLVVKYRCRTGPRPDGKEARPWPSHWIPPGPVPRSGEARAKKLAKLGLTRCAQLLTYFPRDYEDRREIYSIRSAPLGRKVCVRAMAAEHPRLARIRRGLELVQLRVVDQAGPSISPFQSELCGAGPPAPGRSISFGTVEEQGSRRAMVNPIFEPADRRNATGRIIPVYPLTAGIFQPPDARPHPAGGGGLRRSRSGDAAPSIRLEHGLAQAEFAYRNIHFPDTFQALELARRRLTFEELFYLSAGLTMLKTRRGGGSDRQFPPPPGQLSCPAPFPPHRGPGPGDGGDRRGHGLRTGP